MTQANEINAGLALDARALDALKLQAKRNPEQALKAVSQQFEAVFLHTLLKTMRDATPQDGLMDSDQTRAYTSMLDQQMAQSLSAKGIGLAEVMLRQLTRNQAAAGAEPAATPAAPTGSNGVQAAGAQAGQDFLTRMKDHALAASDATGIPARFLLGQAALESGWGKQEIRAADGSQSFNLFGIKAGRNWSGPKVQAMTTEYVDGVPRKTMQTFRSYASYAESFKDYASLLQGSRRYAAVLNQTDSAGFARGLQRAGYATDPQYAEKLTRILEGRQMRRTITA
jgi:flagellar protein FlgJ